MLGFLIRAEMMHGYGKGVLCLTQIYVVYPHKAQWEARGQTLLPDMCEASFLGNQLRGTCKEVVIIRVFQGTK